MRFEGGYNLSNLKTRPRCHGLPYCFPFNINELVYFMQSYYLEAIRVLFQQIRGSLIELVLRIEVTLEDVMFRRKQQVPNMFPMRNLQIDGS